MTKDVKINSKVLVREVNPDHMLELKDFFNQHNLIGLKADNYNSIKETLASNIDLGAIFLCEEQDAEGKNGLEIAMDIHKIRPELPIFMRREGTSSIDGLTAEQQEICAGVYQSGEIEIIKQLIDKYLFNTYYPSAMIRGMESLTEDALKSIFRGLDVNVHQPYLVKDQYIFGELFSLIPLESNWCRGYLMLQCEEKRLSELIKANKTPFPPTETDFRKINDLLGEITNMIWGRIKAKFFQSTVSQGNIYGIQVPIIIDHVRQYISFGNEEPQLCFYFTLEDPEGKIEPVPMYQKFVFNLNWSPEEFKESPEEVDNLVKGGELEFF